MRWLVVLTVFVACAASISGDSANTHVMRLKRRSRNVHVPQERFSIQHDSAPFAHTYMYGAINTTFEYYTAIYLGTDKQTFMVQVDTGSASLAIPSRKCKQYERDSEGSVTKTNEACAHADTFYDSDLSDSSHVISCSSECSQCTRDGDNCGFSLGYGDGSFLFGSLVEDEFSIAGLSTKLKFGQIEAGDAVFDKLVEAGKMSDEFSMCLGYHGGALVIGGVDERYSKGNMTYTPITTDTYYVVDMNDITINGKSINASFGSYSQTIVDSGTTLVVLEQDLFTALVNYFETSVCPTLPVGLRALCKPDSRGVSIFTTGACYNVSRSDISHFPAVEFHLSGALPLALSPELYFLQVTAGYCFGIGGMSGLGNILGDVFMQAYNTHFDRKNNRVGFAPVQNCTFSTASATAVSGDGQSGTVGWEMSDPLVVQVLYDDDNTPAVGLIVEFDVTDGSASLSHARTATDEKGLASTNIRVTHSGKVTVTATLLEGNSVKFTATGKINKIVGAVVGGVLGCVVIVIIVTLLVMRCKRQQPRYRPLSLYDDETTSLKTVIEGDE